MRNEQLTGEIRYRVEQRLFRAPLVVLQVQITWSDGPPDFYGLPLYLAGQDWRDADVSDLWTLKLRSTTK